eukprot:1490778-Alexandrium_andersonii.AAC.1
MAGSVSGWGTFWLVPRREACSGPLCDWVDAPVARGQFDGPCPLRASGRPSLAVLLASPRPPDLLAA